MTRYTVFRGDLYLEIEKLGPGSPSPHPVFRISILDLHKRCVRLETAMAKLVEAMAQDADSLQQHAPNLFKAVAEAIMENMT